MGTNMVYGVEELNGMKTLHFWKGLSDTKDVFWAVVKFSLGKGDRISFWRNKWQDYKQLSCSFPKIYEGTTDKEGSVKFFYRRGAYRVVTIRNGDYQIRDERRKIPRKLENSTPNPEGRDTPVVME